MSTLLRLVAESGTPAIKLVVCTHTDADAVKVYTVSNSLTSTVIQSDVINIDIGHDHEC